MTSPTSPSATPTPDPNRPEAADVGALFDAVATEHATIYGYGIVSAYALSTRNARSDSAVACSSTARQATAESDRAFGLTALTQCAVLGARWRRVLREWPVTKAFPGGGE
ncbi:MAG: DUF4439 domain-containing protein [Mycobacteriaceae bacterium]|nr:DUF4439 domain-containing protein [Mycobacteriaceae bacterium]